ncbi:MAG: phosphoribosylformylglycinamidine synthase subunit PurQ [Nitrospiria bacterium]
MRTGIIVFPGSNCDHDCRFVTRDLLGEPTLSIWHKETRLPPLDLVIVPGGFSYGDYLRPGAIARFSPVMDAVIDFARQGGYVLGICNGFQILIEVGLLPGTLLRNRSMKFVCKAVSIRVENNRTPFTSQYREGQILSIPIAHAEGNYFIEPSSLKEMNQRKQILFRYVTEKGETSEASNPNGSIDHVAGLCNEAGNILGMMPHPERASDLLLGGDDGIGIFHSLQAARAKDQ